MCLLNQHFIWLLLCYLDILKTLRSIASKQGNYSNMDVGDVCVFICQLHWSAREIFVYAE